MIKVGFVGLGDQGGPIAQRIIDQGLTVRVFEDLHWCDEDSFEMIDFLMGALSDQPVVVLILARPEMTRTFPIEPERLVHVELSELSRQDSVRLLHNLLGFEGLPMA
ncbi:MAG: hypothetical protein IIB12_07115, partial [Chloroflexi bacterium]|nr:hypothetical protein [Chloroflexota bacterium]